MASEQNRLLRIADRGCFIASGAILAGIAVWSVAGRVADVTLPARLTKWVLPALTAAAVGYLTNYLAIALLFRPYRPVKWLHGLQGIVPREQGALAKRLGEEIPASLLPPEGLADQLGCMVSSYLGDPALADSVREKVCFYVRHRKAQIASRLMPRLAEAIRDGLDAFFTPERIRDFYRDHGSELLEKQISDSGLTETILTELRNRAPEITTAIRRMVRAGAEDYVRDEYPQLSRWVHADRFAAQMVTKLNWELIQEKLSGALAEPAARGVVRDELAALEEKLKAYVLSPEMASDLDGLKAVYLEKLVAGCETVLAENLPDWLERALSQDDVWQMARDEVLPAIRVFLLHQIKRNREALVAGLKLSDRIEKAILDQKPEDIHALVNRVSGEQLVMLQLLGFLLGGIAGVLLSFAQ